MSDPTQFNSKFWYSLNRKGRCISTWRGGNVHVNRSSLFQAQFTAFRVIFKHWWWRFTGIQEMDLFIKPSVSAKNERTLRQWTVTCSSVNLHINLENIQNGSETN